LKRGQKPKIGPRNIEKVEHKSKDFSLQNKNSKIFLKNGKVLAPQALP